MERFYSWRIVSYLDEEVFKGIVEKVCKAWAYIIHDKDIKANGEPEEKHIQAVLVFEQQKSLERVRSYFEVGKDNTLGKPVTKGMLKEAYEYLDHRHEEGKHHYSPDEIKSHSKEYWARVTKEEDDERGSNDEFVDDLCQTDFSYERMARKYGRDFMRYANAYITYREHILRERGGEPTK